MVPDRRDAVFHAAVAVHVQRIGQVARLDMGGDHVRCRSPVRIHQQGIGTRQALNGMAERV